MWDKEQLTRNAPTPSPKDGKYMAAPILDDENPVAGAGMADSSTAIPFEPCAAGAVVVTGATVVVGTGFTTGATVVVGTGFTTGATVVVGTGFTTGAATAAPFVGAGLLKGGKGKQDDIANARTMPTAPTETDRGERFRRNSVPSSSRPSDEPRSVPSVRFFIVLPILGTSELEALSAGHHAT